MSYIDKLLLCRKIQHSDPVSNLGYRATIYRKSDKIEHLELYDCVSKIYITSPNCKDWDERQINEWFYDNTLKLLYRINYGGELLCE